MSLAEPLTGAAVEPLADIQVHCTTVGRVQIVWASGLRDPRFCGVPTRGPAIATDMASAEPDPDDDLVDAPNDEPEPEPESETPAAAESGDVPLRILSITDPNRRFRPRRWGRPGHLNHLHRAGHITFMPYPTLGWARKHLSKRYEIALDAVECEAAEAKVAPHPSWAAK